MHLQLAKPPTVLDKWEGGGWGEGVAGWVRGGGGGEGGGGGGGRFLLREGRYNFKCCKKSVETG